MYIEGILSNLCNRNFPQKSAKSGLPQKSAKVHASACVLWSFPYLPIYLLVWLVYSYELRPLTN